MGYMITILQNAGYKLSDFTVADKILEDHYVRELNQVNDLIREYHTDRHVSIEEGLWTLKSSDDQRTMIVSWMPLIIAR